MKVKLILILTFVLSMNLWSQSIAEKFNGLKTDFIITSDTMVFEVFDQLLVKKGVYSVGGFYDGGYGYATEALQLEFITRQEIQTQKVYGSRDLFHVIQLIDANGNVLAKVYPAVEQIKLITNREEPRLNTYTIDLIDVPIILLDKTSKIDIVLRDQKFRHPIKK